MLNPYYVMLYGGLASRLHAQYEGNCFLLTMLLASMYMMGRMVLGHKTWYG